MTMQPIVPISSDPAVVLSGAMSPRIRRATLADLPDIIRLLIGGDLAGTHKDTLDEGARAAYLDAFAAIDANPHEMLFVAELDDKVVGTFQITFGQTLVGRGRLRATIESVHVASEVRGKGLGAAMIAHALDVARTQGARVAQLTSNKIRTDAHRFYERLGFKRSHEGFKLDL
jgi:GNAT superfamily N-acetyltransferase